MTDHKTQSEASATKPAEPIDRRELITRLLGAAGVVGLASACGPAPADLPSSLGQDKEALNTSFASCDSLAELRSYAINPYPVIIVTGHTTPGDGGGGIFQWIPSTGTDDNGLTVVPVPPPNYPYTPPIGHYRRLFSGDIDVRWFGAKGDGATPDTVAIQAAINTVIAAGGGVIFFPHGTYAIESTIDASRPANIDLRLIGESATLLATSTFQIEAIIKITRTTEQSAYRFHTTIRGLNLKGAQKAYYGIRVPFVSGSDILTISNSYIENCHIGIDLESTMESHFSDLSLFNNDIGLRLRPANTAGGGNANDFHGIKITNGQIGVALYAPVDQYPFGNNTFTGLLTQGQRIAGIFAAGAMIGNQVFVGGHIENIPTPGTTTVDMGDFGAPHTLSLKNADILVYSAQLTLIGVGSVDSAVADSHSTLESGRGTNLGTLITRDSNLGGNYGIATRFNQFEATGTYLDHCLLEANRGLISLRGFHRSTVALESIPPSTKCLGPSVMSPTDYIDPPATSALEYISGVGRVLAVSFAPSVSSWATNALRRGLTGPLPAGKWIYSSALLRSDTDTTMIIQVSGDAGISYDTIHLRAGKWTLVRQATTAWGTQVNVGLSIHPAGTDGPTVRIARVHMQIADDPFHAAQMFNANEVEPDISCAVTLSPGPIASGASFTSADILTTGAMLGDPVIVTAPYDLQGVTASGYIKASNVVKVCLANLTGSPVTLAAANWVIRVEKT